MVEVFIAPKGTKGSYLGMRSTAINEVEFTLQAGTSNKTVLLGAEMSGDKVIVYKYLTQ